MPSVNVIKGALQPVSVPPADTYMATLASSAWSGPHGSKLLIPGYNPNQVPETNLRSNAVTRTVGGMATHWTCASRACPLIGLNKAPLIPSNF